MRGGVVEVCRRRGMKVNINKSKGMVLGGEEGSVCEVIVDGSRLGSASEFGHFGFVLDESGKDEVEYCGREASGMKLTGAVRSLVNARSLQLEWTRASHLVLLLPVNVWK